MSQQAGGLTRRAVYYRYLLCSVCFMEPANVCVLTQDHFYYYVVIKDFPIIFVLFCFMCLRTSEERPWPVIRPIRVCVISLEHLEATAKDSFSLSLFTGKGFYWPVCIMWSCNRRLCSAHELLYRTFHQSCYREPWCDFLLLLFWRKEASS